MEPTVVARVYPALLSKMRLVRGMTAIHDGHVRVGLLDLVPITLGRLHTGALRTLLLLDDDTAGPGLRELVGLPRAEVPASAELRLEHRIYRRRADLAICGDTKIAIETKVYDPFDWDQFSAYQAGEDGWKPVLYAPMLTGFLVEANLTKPSDGWQPPITSTRFLDAIEGAELPPLLDEYGGGIRKFDDRRKLAQECNGDLACRPEGVSQGDLGMVEAIWKVAWIRAVKEGLLPDGGVDGNWSFRATRNDYGLWWGAPRAGNWRIALPGGGSVEAFIDIVADRTCDKRSVRIKISGGSPDEKAAAHELLVRQGVSDDWRPGQRRFSRDTLTVWACSAPSAAEGIEAARHARTWLEEHAAEDRTRVG